MARTEKRFDLMGSTYQQLGEKVHVWLVEVGSTKHFRTWIDHEKQELVVEAVDAEAA